MKFLKILLLIILLNGCSFIDLFMDDDSIPEYNGDYDSTSKSEMDGTLWELKSDEFNGNVIIYPNKDDYYYDLDNDGLIETMSTSIFLFFKGGKTTTYKLVTHEELSIQPDISESTYIIEDYSGKLNELTLIYDYQPVDYDVKEGVVYIKIDEQDEYCYRKDNTLYGLYKDGGSECMSTYVLSTKFTEEELLAAQ